MNNHARRHNRPTNDELHATVYKSVIGLAAWFVLSVWLLFDRSGATYAGLAFTMITLFFFVVVSIPVLLWLTWRRNTAMEERPRDLEPFRIWVMHEFATASGTVSGGEAAAQILLPIAAVSIGITIFGLAFLFAVPQLSY